MATPTTVESSSFKTFLMVYEGSAWKKLIDIKDYPDLGGSPEMLEVTTLSDPMTRQIMGIQSADAMEFTLNYIPSDYQKLKKYQEEGTELDLAIYFGGTESGGVVTPSGDDDKFFFKGTVSVYISGAGTNEVREMTLSVARSTVITQTDPHA